MRDGGGGKERNDEEGGHLFMRVGGPCARAGDLLMRVIDASPDKRFVGPKSGRLFSAIFAQTLSPFSGALFTSVNNLVILLLLCCFPGVSVTVIPDAYGTLYSVCYGSQLIVIKVPLVVSYSPTPILQQLVNLLLP